MSVATILKYELEPGVTRIRGHVGARPLSAGLDARGVPCVWFETHGDHGGSCDIEVQIVGTGKEFDPHGWQYIATWAMPDVGLVLHAFWHTIHR